VLLLLNALVAWLDHLRYVVLEENGRLRVIRRQPVGP
jgi:hypothetical protein